MYPELAALAQAAMDEEWEHGAAVVDRAVAEGLDLIASLKDEGVDLLLELLSRPHMLRSDNVIHNLAKAAESAGDEDVARRARSMLKTDPRRPPASGGSSTTDQVPAADKLHQPSPGTGDNGMAYGPAESQTLGRELSPAYIGPEPPRAWGVAIWAEGFLPQAPVTVELDGYVIDQLYTDAGGAITNYESTSPGSTPPRSLRVSGWVEPGAPSPTGGSDLWPIYD